MAEGYAVDNQRGIFYTNIEEAGKTVAIDVRLHKVIATWNPGSSDLQGLALDTARRFLFVACGDHVVSIDADHDGKVLDSITTGPGLDNIDYSADAKLLYAAASRAATLTIAEVGDDGKFHLKGYGAHGERRARRCGWQRRDRISNRSSQRTHPQAHTQVAAHAIRIRWAATKRK